MKTYSALDRTTSALPNNMNNQSVMSRNAQSSLAENHNRFSPQAMSSSPTISSSSTTYASQRNMMPSSNYNTNPTISNMQRPPYPYQPQRQMAPSVPQRQPMQQQQQQQHHAQPIQTHVQTTRCAPTTSVVTHARVGVEPTKHVL